MQIFIIVCQLIIFALLCYNLRSLRQLSATLRELRTAQQNLSGRIRTVEDHLKLYR